MKRLLTLFLALVAEANSLQTMTSPAMPTILKRLTGPKRTLKSPQLTLPAALPIPAPVLLVPSWVSIWV